MTVGCQVFASTDFKERRAAGVETLQQELAPRLQLLHGEKIKYSYYILDPVERNNNFKLYWGRIFLSDQTVAHTRPDLPLDHISWKNDAHGNGYPKY